MSLVHLLGAARFCRPISSVFLSSAMSSETVSNGVKREMPETETAPLPKKPCTSEDGVTTQEGASADGDGKLAPAAGKAAQAEESGPERQKLKKVLLLVSYSGKGYLGMQRNPGCRTIEEELLQALHRAGAIPAHGLREQQSIWFQRAARTDKGVSAAKQAVSLKMAVEEGVLDAINSHLPGQIRVFDMRRVTKRFDAKLQCCARTYQYVSPTFAFAPIETTLTNDFRIGEDNLKNVNRLFGKYTGTHNYHNFTSRRKPSDPSNNRYIMQMDCGDPFVRNGIEFVVVTVKGQSFMLHQIRKMIGTVMAVARGVADESVLERAWSLTRIDLPMAPALGLLLHEVHYDRYNKRFGSGGSNTHENIDWHSVDDKIKAFTEQYIYADIVDTELKENSMLSWLSTLPLHTFDVREGDKSPPLLAAQQAAADPGVPRTGSETGELRSGEADSSTAPDAASTAADPADAQADSGSSKAPAGQAAPPATDCDSTEAAR